MFVTFLVFMYVLIHCRLKTMYLQKWSMEENDIHDTIVMNSYKWKPDIRSFSQIDTLVFGRFAGGTVLWRR